MFTNVRCKLGQNIHANGAVLLKCMYVLYEIIIWNLTKPLNRRSAFL